MGIARQLITAVACLGLICAAALAYVLLSGPEDRLSAAAVPLTPLPVAAAAVAPTATPFAPPSPTGTPLRTSPTPTWPDASSVALAVANTGGRGAVIRRAPVDGERIRAWAEGTAMWVVGPDWLVGDAIWKNVRDPAGNVGWVLGDLLTPLPTPSGRPTAMPTPSPTPSPAVVPTPTPTAVSPTQPGRGLRLLSASGYRQNGHVVVEGQVVNAGDGELRSVWATAYWYKADGELVKTQSAPIKRDPLLPAQVSSFAVVAVDDAAIEVYSVDFRGLRDGPIPLVDAR